MSVNWRAWLHTLFRLDRYKSDEEYLRYLERLTPEQWMKRGELWEALRQHSNAQLGYLGSTVACSGFFIYGFLAQSSMAIAWAMALASTIGWLTFARLANVEDKRAEALRRELGLLKE